MEGPPGAIRDETCGPRAWSLVGHLPHLFWNLVLARGSLVSALQRMFRMYRRKTLALRLGPLRVTATVDPEQAHRILVAEAARHQKTRWEANILRPAMDGGLIILDGAEWERHHRAVVPCFRPAAMPALVTTVSAVARSRMDRWSDRVDVGHEMRCIVNGAMFRFFLGGLELEAAEGPGAIDRYSRLFERIEKGLETRVADRLFLQERLRALLHPAASFWRALGEVTRPIVRVIQGKCPVDHSGGALDLLLRDLPADEAAKEIRTMFGAGATTGHLLSWICDLLARHPEVQARLRRAIQERLGAPGREPSLADLEAIPYLTAVIQEGLRLFPPAPFLLRRDRDDRTAFHFVFVFGMHRDPDFWRRPETFEPERWLEPERAGELQVGSWEPFIPFGMGPRVCIGKRFALLEARAILVELSRRFELSPASPPGRRPKPVVTILTRPSRPVEVTVRAVP